MPPATPFTCHVTPVFEACETAAVNCCVAFAVRLTAAGEIVTTTAGMIVTWALAVWVPSAFETAVTVTVISLATVPGAVYIPDADIVPAEELPPATPFTSQSTAVSDVFLTVALNWVDSPAVTREDGGEMATLTAGAGETAGAELSVAQPKENSSRPKTKRSRRRHPNLAFTVDLWRTRRA